ncbi:hypothetical protein AB0F43_27600 [Kribbella sp. NPDC023972]|uniref:hypothetical protein n=1 Tax=Kribbella sp. NPDC023972 TaxID=3154795 RepID=UPI0033F8B947
MRRLVVVVGVVGLLFVAACGEDGETPVAASPSPPASPSATPSTTPERSAPVVRATPVQLSVAAAGKRYLQVTRPYNVALERFEKAANGNASVATLQARARAVAAANLAESQALSSITWPSKVAPQIKALVKADVAARPHWLRVAAADSLSEMARHVKLASAESGKAPAAEIRRLLGLPKYDEKDYS